MTGRRVGLGDDDRQDFSSWAKLKLIDNNYAMLRKHRGESLLTTYLQAVITNLARDYRIHLWGRWRASAKATRLGPVAVELERLLVRDGYALEEAIQSLVSRGVELSRAVLIGLAERLPPRVCRRFEGPEALQQLSVDGRTEGRLVDRERTATRSTTERALQTALSALKREDRWLLKRHFGQSTTIAQIAAELRVNQKSLYSRRDRCLRDLRQALEHQGVTWNRISGLVGWERNSMSLFAAD